MSIWQKRTPETINEWLRKNADGLRIKKVSSGLYQVYSRFNRDPESRIVYLGDLTSCRVAIMGVIRRCSNVMAR